MKPRNYEKMHWKERKKMREDYIKYQNHKCWYCNSNIHACPPDRIGGMEIDTSLFPDNFFNYPIHLHHDHETGMTIGAVHNVCNAILWQYEGK